MLFFALCGAWVLSYLQISEAAFKIAGGIILFLVALDMLAAKRQQRKREQSTSDQQTSSSEPENDNPAIYPLAIPLLAGPAAIMSVIVVNASFAGALTSTIIGYASLIAVMVATGLILCMTVIAESWLNERVTMVFSRITAIILAGLSVQYVIDESNFRNRSLGNYHPKVFTPHECRFGDELAIKVEPFAPVSLTFFATFIGSSYSQMATPFMVTFSLVSMIVRLRWPCCFK